MGAWIKIEEGETPDSYVNLDRISDVSFADGSVTVRLDNFIVWTFVQPEVVARIKEFVERNQFPTHAEIDALMDAQRERDTRRWGGGKPR